MAREKALLQMWALLLTAAALCLSGTEAEINCDHGNSAVIQGNPIGTCACDGHLWVAEGCQEGFFCYDTQANGCHITCEENEILYTNFANEFWDCRVNAPPTIRSLMEGETEEELLAGYDNILAEGLPDQQALLVCPAGGYDLCPSGNVATTPFPPEEADGNPLGTCRCDGEMWLAEGCKYGFLCDESEDIGGTYLYCDDPDEVVSIWPGLGTWNCTTETASCYGGAVLGVGCPMPECQYSKNPFGACECEEQFFINDECTEGFWCSGNIPDPYLYDGCYQKCYDGQVLQPDFAGKTWQCVNEEEQKLCPGNFKLECDPIGDFDLYDCDCPDGQLLMNGDCTESFYCRSRSVGGGVPITCPPGQIVSLDFNAWAWACVDDNGNCPGLGGFKLGCSDGGNIEQPDLDCNFGINPYGECECESQIYINEDCTRAFYCSEHIPSDENPDFNGCQLTCNADERIYYESEQFDLKCVPRENDYVCPGQFAIDCPGQGGFEVDCNCDNELWMNRDCSQAFICNSENPDGTFEGSFYRCPEGEFYDVDLDNVLDVQCSADPSVCPGSFHFGCLGGDITDIFEDPHDCLPLKNPFGTCECEEQFFINDDCTEGFFCTENVDDPLLYDGCFKTCGQGQVLQPDFVNKNWTCVDESVQRICPGAFHLECQDTGDFSVHDCDCPTGQLHMNGDCTESFYCRDRSPNGGVAIKCEQEGQIVSLDYDNWSWSCKDDNGNCPGLGGFKVGCDGSSNVTPPPLSCNYGVNPYGQCDCETQVFINEDCTKGFYCSQFVPEDGSDDFNGCQLSCNPDERIHYDPDTRVWDCVTREEDYVCPGLFGTDCPGATFNPTCNCDNELWMNDDCSRAYVCNNERLDGSFDGYFLDCPDGETFDVSLDDVLVMTCSSSHGSCPGSYHFGCEGGDIGDLFGTKNESLPSINPFGTCECEGQFFIDDQCQEGFYCTEYIDDNLLYDGYIKRCPSGQVLQPDFENNHWACVNADQQRICPGSFKLECTDIGDFDSSDCDCPTGQLHMNGDCTESFYCRDRSPDGGVALKCEEEGQIVSLDYDNWSWSCKDDTGNCPGLGGFKVGCTGDSNVTPPPLECDFGVNPYGNCDCEAQVFINDDCSKGFYCSAFIPEGEPSATNGCQLSCQSDERIHYDPGTGVWECVTREADYVCPGEFGTDCPTGSFDVDCNCDNELWMNDDCSRAYFCSSERDVNTYDGYFLDCPDDQFWDISLDNILGMTCSANPGVCHGGFHFGCDGGDIGDIFTPPPTVGTTTAGAVTLLANIVLLAISVIFFAFANM